MISIAGELTLCCMVLSIVGQKANTVAACGLHLTHGVEEIFMEMGTFDMRAVSTALSQGKASGDPTDL